MRVMGTVANTISHGKVERERTREKPTRQWLEWTGLSSNEMWREPEDRVAWRNRAVLSRVALTG